MLILQKRARPINARNFWDLGPDEQRPNISSKLPRSMNYDKVSLDRLGIHPNRDNGALEEDHSRMKHLFLCLLLNGILTPATFGNEVVKFAIGEYPPYTSSRHSNARILEVLVRAAFKLQDIDVEYGYYPWKRSYALAKNGDVDGTFPWLKNSDRLQDFYIGDQEIYQDQGVYWHLRSTPFDWSTAEDLRKYKFGVTVGYTRTQEFYNTLGIKAESEVTEESNFKKLLAGRIDVYRTSRVVGTYLIGSLFSAKARNRFVFHPRVSDDSLFFILFSKKTDRGKRLEQEFSIGLEKLKASGRYQRIIQGLDYYREKVAPKQHPNQKSKQISEPE